MYTYIIDYFGSSQYRASLDVQMLVLFSFNAHNA